MKKLMLFALLGTSVGSALGAAARPETERATEKPIFADHKVSMAEAIKDVQTYLTPLYAKTEIGRVSLWHLMDALNAAIYKGKLQEAGIYATLVTTFVEKRKLVPIELLVDGQLETLAHYGVPEAVLAPIRSQMQALAAGK